MMKTPPGMIAICELYKAIDELCEEQDTKSLIHTPQCNVCYREILEDGHVTRAKIGIVCLECFSRLI